MPQVEPHIHQAIALNKLMLTLIRTPVPDKRAMELALEQQIENLHEMLEELENN